MCVFLESNLHQPRTPRSISYNTKMLHTCAGLPGLFSRCCLLRIAARRLGFIGSICGNSVSIFCSPLAIWCRKQNATLPTLKHPLGILYRPIKDDGCETLQIFSFLNYHSFGRHWLAIMLRSTATCNVRMHERCTCRCMSNGCAKILL